MCGLQLHFTVNVCETAEGAWCSLHGGGLHKPIRHPGSSPCSPPPLEPGPHLPPAQQPPAPYRHSQPLRSEGVTDIRHLGLPSRVPVEIVPGCQPQPVSAERGSPGTLRPSHCLCRFWRVWLLQVSFKTSLSLCGHLFLSQGTLNS